MAITEDMMGLIDPDDPNDPIARQFVPDGKELDIRPEETGRPHWRLTPHAGNGAFVHRYPDRVLLKPVHVWPGVLPVLLSARGSGRRRHWPLSPGARGGSGLHSGQHRHLGG